LRQLVSSTRRRPTVGDRASWWYYKRKAVCPQHKGGQCATKELVSGSRRQSTPETTGSVVLQEWVHESHSSARGANQEPQCKEVVGVRISFGTIQRAGCYYRRMQAAVCHGAERQPQECHCWHDNTTKPRIDRSTARVNLNYEKTVW
jgi:hypothetical protein